MKINSNTLVKGSSVTLVPYRKEHVSLYHAWMQDPKLQEATASEPLTLQEEYDMQLSWSEDANKCTFILLDPTLLDTEGTGCHGGGMVGDVNLYLNDADDPKTGEIEIMVAEASSRRKGVAYEALHLFMAYTVKHLTLCSLHGLHCPMFESKHIQGICCFQAKIGIKNVSSLRLFEKLGYTEVSRSKVFNEATLRLEVSGHVSKALLQQAENLHIEKYDNCQ